MATIAILELQRLRLSNCSAFDRIYAQLSFPVYCMAMGVLCDRGHAEEVAQEALTEVWLTASR